MCFLIKLIETNNGLIIELQVKPNSRNFSLFMENNCLMVYCCNQPVKNKVNKEIVNELSKLFNAKIKIISGLTSRQKKILIENFSKENFELIQQKLPIKL